MAFCVGTDLFSQAASHQVFSARMSLTTVFGMGTGGPSSLMTPTLHDNQPVINWNTEIIPQKTTNFKCFLQNTK